MPPEIQTFPELIRWIIDTHHHGVALDFARRMKLSSAAPLFWLTGTNGPSRENIQKLCDVYGLDYWDVLGLVIGKRPPRSAGSGSAALPEQRATGTMDSVSPPPLLPRKRRRSPHARHNADTLPLIGRLWARRWGLRAA